MILTKITTLEFSVAKRACKASPELQLTSALTEVGEADLDGETCKVS